MNPLAALLTGDPDQVILTVRNGEIFISFIEADERRRGVKFSAQLHERSVR